MLQKSDLTGYGFKTTGMKFASRCMNQTGSFARMNSSNMNKSSIDRVLVVVDPDQMTLDQPEQSDLLQRALGLAQATCCELELFSAYYDPSLELALFAGREEVNQEKDRITDSAATKLGEIALEMKNHGAKVSHEVRWDQPYSEALLRKISESDPDLVMKASHGPSYVMGLTDNPDWELIRKSPSHIWFVKGGAPEINTVLTAIGETVVDEGIISESDYRVFEIGSLLAGSLGANNVPIHSYEVPRLHAYTAYAPMLAGSTQVAQQVENWDEIARMHGQAIRKFAKHFDINMDQIEIAKGPAVEVIPAFANSLNAGLVVMGARNLGRWERFLSSVAAEPVLSSVPCDIVFVKEAEGLDAPVAEKQPRRGIPSVNLELAITEPDKVFESPKSVVETDDLTIGLRRRILDAWELDVNRQMTAEDEGGPVQDAPSHILAEINSAKESLARNDG